MDPFAPNYLLFAVSIAAGLMLGILTNFIKPKWWVMLYFLWIYTGIAISSGSPVWSKGILEGIWQIITLGTIELFIPISLLAGATYLIGRHGYRFVLKMTKKSKQNGLG